MLPPPSSQPPLLTTGFRSPANRYVLFSSCTSQTPFTAIDEGRTNQLIQALLTHLAPRKQSRWVPSSTSKSFRRRSSRISSSSSSESAAGKYVELPHLHPLSFVGFSLEIANQNRNLRENEHIYSVGGLWLVFPRYHSFGLHTLLGLPHENHKFQDRYLFSLSRSLPAMASERGGRRYFQFLDGSRVEGGGEMGATIRDRF